MNVTLYYIHWSYQHIIQENANLFDLWNKVILFIWTVNFSLTYFSFIL